MRRAAEAHRGTRRPNDNLVGLERFRAADHHARTNPALPDGPLTRTRSGDCRLCAGDKAYRAYEKRAQIIRFGCHSLAPAVREIV